ncbi:MAG: type II secretion system protein GspC [Thiomargarita sp.]|nr:type II secretion system protein GspC [Thiomargarita sp.]
MFFIKLLSFTINIILSGILGYYIIYLLLSTQLLFPNQQNTKPNIKSFSSTEKFSKQNLDVSNLTSNYLFGQANIKAQITTQSNISSAPITKLDLILDGIFYNSNSNLSRVTITTDTSKVYKIGDFLDKIEVKIHEIHPKKVILLRNGVTETLKFIGLKNSNTDTTKVTNLTKRKAKNNISPGKLFGNYQKQLKKNPAKLMNLLRIYPVEKAGRFIGYRLKPGQNRNLLSRFDLQSGDILTTINGIKLNSPMQGIKAIQQLATANKIDIEILRNGQIEFISFKVE